MAVLTSTSAYIAPSVSRSRMVVKPFITAVRTAAAAPPEASRAGLGRGGRRARSAWRRHRLTAPCWGATLASYGATSYGNDLEVVPLPLSPEVVPSPTTSCTEYEPSVLAVNVVDAAWASAKVPVESRGWVAKLQAYEND